MEEQAYYTEGADDKLVEREGQVVTALKQLESLIGDVDVLSERMAKRLEPIIAHHPEKAGDVPHDRASGAPLADEIERLNDRLRQVSGRLRYLLDTIQV